MRGDRDHELAREALDAQLVGILVPVAHELVHVLDAAATAGAPRVGACRDGYDDPDELRVERLASELMISIASHGSSASRLTSLELYR